MHLNNKGITLVELIIAIAISFIIFGAAMLFISSAQRGYDTASAEINLQSEAQILMEQMSEWVMEGNKIEIDTDKLVVYRINTAATGLTNTKRVIWLGSGGKLYMKKFNDISLDVNISVDETMENCIGEYVVDFSPGYNAADKNKVILQLKLGIGSREYEINDTIKVRNAIVAGIRCLERGKAA